MADFFPEIPAIRYEGPQSKNPLAFKHYNPDEVVEGTKLRDLLRFSICYWHTFRGTGSDPFGSATLQRRTTGRTRLKMRFSECTRRSNSLRKWAPRSTASMIAMWRLREILSRNRISTSTMWRRP